MYTANCWLPMKKRCPVCMIDPFCQRAHSSQEHSWRLSEHQVWRWWRQDMWESRTRATREPVDARICFWLLYDHSWSSFISVQLSLVVDYMFCQKVDVWFRDAVEKSLLCQSAGLPLLPREEHRYPFIGFLFCKFDSSLQVQVFF